MDGGFVLALIGVGLTINAAMLAYVVRVENRLTTIETTLNHLQKA